MSNLKKLGLTALACLVLSACSSGGGNGDSTPTSQPTNNSTVIPATSSSSTSSATSSPSTSATDNSTGKVIVISGTIDTHQADTKTLTDASNLNVITVDGKEIRVAYADQGINAGTWTQMSSSQGNLYSCCGKFTDVRFGAIGSTGPEENDYIFYNGNPTKVMPTSGTANYNGHFIVTGDGSSAFDDEDYLTGTAQFTADFANKTITGSMQTELLQPINVNAKINGNGFTGSATSTSLVGTADVDGKFFGSNAKELGGVFNSLNDQDNAWGGAFGASQ